MRAHLTLVSALLALLVVLASSQEEVSKSSRIKYIIVIDAGSTGTRLNAYKFQLDSSRSTGLKILDLRGKKISPGLSAYKNFPGRLREAMTPLLDSAAEYVPASHHGSTTAIVRATAGLRMLDPQSRLAVSRVVVEVLRRSPFVVPAEDDRAVRVITGSEEAEFGWVSVNFLLDAFDQPTGETFGMLDMGGGSTQIAFVPRVDDLSDSNRVVFQTMRGKNYILHQRSYLGLGMSQATLTMLGHEASDPSGRSYVTPCLSPDFSGTHSFGGVTVKVTGEAGVAPAERLALCMRAAERVLQVVPVQPPPSALHSKFVAVSSFFYVSQTLRKADPGWTRTVPGNVTLGDFVAAANRMCANPPSAGKYAPYLCMSLSHIVTLLRTGYQFSEDQAFYVADKINGYPAGWSLGLAIHYLTCYDPVNVRCLVPGSSRGSQIAWPGAWSWAAVLEQLLAG